MKILKISAILLLVLISIASCTFKSIKPTISQKDLPSDCSGLISTIENSWKQHKKLKNYKYDEEFLNEIQKYYKNCMMKLNKEEVVKLFGKPTEDLEKDYAFYSLNEGCMEKLPKDCKVLFFQFREDNGLMLIYLVQEHTVHIDNKYN